MVNLHKCFAPIFWVFMYVGGVGSDGGEQRVAARLKA
jgi:hypothetical protein